MFFKVSELDEHPGHGAAAEAVAAATPPQPVPDQGREAGAGGGLQHEPRPGLQLVRQRPEEAQERRPGPAVQGKNGNTL